MYKARPEGYVMSDREAALLAIEETGFALHRQVTTFIKFPTGSWLNEYEFADVLSDRLKTAINKTMVSIPDRYKDHVREVQYVRYVKDIETKKARFETNDKQVGFSTDSEAIMAILGMSPRPEESAMLAKVEKAQRYSCSTTQASDA